MLDRILAAAALGALTAGLTRLICPNPPWWAVGVIVAVVVLLPPSPPVK
ncbi:hypothetical protein ACKI16_29765 [Streptomyces scabiei]